MTAHDHSDHGTDNTPNEAQPANACCSGHCANVAMPVPLANSQKAVTGTGVQTPIRIMQMDCPTEEALLRKKLGDLAGVDGMEFNLMQRVLTVTHEPHALEPILAAVRSLGFAPEIATGAPTPDAPKPEAVKAWWPLAIAGLAAIASEVVQWAGLPTGLAAALAVVAVLASGTSTFKKGWVAIRNGNLNINALMSIAVTGALLLGQWPEAAMVMVLFTIAELIEAKSLDRARNAIQELMRLTPERATVQQADGSWCEVDAKLVAVAARVRVRPGERIALDGSIVSGRSTINQAPITGESLPVDKVEGRCRFCRNHQRVRVLRIRGHCDSGTSTLARIIHAVEAAQGARAPTQRFVDQFARVYTPVVFAIAVRLLFFPRCCWAVAGWNGSTRRWCCWSSPVRARW
jgi:Cd2+/Zn2+-exporting ATPase